MKTKNGHIFTFSEKMQISAILCFATCDWFCPMMSHMCDKISKKSVTCPRCLLYYPNGQTIGSRYMQHSEPVTLNKLV